MVTPSAANKSGCSAPFNHLSIATSDRMSASEPGRLTAKLRAPVSPNRSNNAKLTAATVGVSRASISLISWPGCNPACSAIDPGATVAISGMTPISPRRNRPQSTNIASRKFAAGPAAAMALRLPTDCRLKARGRSAAAMSPSRSSAIRT